METDLARTEDFADLVADRRDTSGRRLVADLDELYSDVVLSDTTRRIIAAALHTHALRAERDTGGKWLPRRGLRTVYRVVPRPLLVAATLLLTLLVLGGAALAAEPLLSQVFDMEPGTQQLLELNLAQDVRIVRHVDGFTVTFAKVYADSNRVIIGYTVATPPNHDDELSLLNPVLTTSEGQTLPGGAAYGSGIEDNAEATLAFFDASQITGTPSQLQLHLSARGLGGLEDAGKPSVHAYQVLGAIDIDFTVAFHPGHIATPHETVTVGGQSMTLERIVVTPSQVRVYLRLDGEDEQWLYGTLSVGDWNSSPGQGDHGPQGVGSTPDGLTVLSYSDSIYDKHGASTLVVRYSSNSQAPRGGPWTFHFTLP